jgi:hypothetical protein
MDIILFSQQAFELPCHAGLAVGHAENPVLPDRDDEVEDVGTPLRRWMAAYNDGIIPLSPRFWPG